MPRLNPRKSTYMCKWCGTRYCRDCLHGDFPGLMKEATHCRICNQKKCQGNRVEYVARVKEEEDPKAKLLAKRGAASARSRGVKGSAKSSKSANSAKDARTKSAKKSGKKKKKK